MTKIVLWVSDLERQMEFYMKLLDATIAHQSDGFAEVASATNSVLLHQLPEQYRAQFPLTSQLATQDEVAIKPVFTVESLEASQQRTSGSFASFAAQKNTYGEFTYQDVVDPEGNVIQLQQKL